MRAFGSGVGHAGQSNWSSSLYQSNIARGSRGSALLIIDPQNDFHPGGSLAIPTANDDAKKIRDLITANIDSLEHIYVTLDTHQRYHIAHSLFWMNKHNEHPEPFTTITKESVESGEWRATRKEHQSWALTYVSALSKHGNFVLTIWPDHCLLGSKGHNVSPIIEAALAEWELKHSKSVSYIIKGNNSLTEHYSAIKAEVLVASDKNTDTNLKFVNELKKHRSILVCGQASSHCVNFTVRDIVDNWGPFNDLAKISILQDAMSPVTGFEEAERKFFRDMNAKGLTMSKSTSIKLK
mmetsp:Transcript_7307/g.8384  ORF Transcript_7307/g.8384 Transcript_7307/m.8384 type:complete len:295 (+) Transcript_7307:357-1241(+)|eukprot:CAMPEP_0184013712 /NCGR_PEP_ID=MMETSP0954-20121128/5178_1 /TAXON_ID=627963 /ORGANISM="Aplanochytrium sp, Strain PBS07" /LENGTH=294 /DNA_ID=CAMNT_0026293957 /DNA_START=311 /DNA_END=1195 /DNA_ORIENTATION=+